MAKVKSGSDKPKSGLRLFQQKFSEQAQCGAPYFPPLPREEWDFSGLAELLSQRPQALRHVFLWELDRELGSGSLPFSALSPEQKLSVIGDAKVPDEEEIRCVPFSEFLELWLKNSEICLHHKSIKPRDLKFRDAATITSEMPDFVMGEATYSTIQALEIDWTKSENALVEGFRKFLQQSGVGGFSTSHNVRNKSAHRKKPDFAPDLRELAIYRLRVKGGKTTKEINALLKPLKQPFGVGSDENDREYGNLSAANCSHAIKAAERAINARYTGLLIVAENSDEGESKGWRDYLRRL